MSVWLNNTAEGGTNGTTPTHANSGGASGTAIDGSNVGTGATFTFDNAQAAHGTLSYKFTSSSSGSSAFFWTTAMGTVTEIWGHFYVYLTANPLSIMRVALFKNGSTKEGSIDILTTGHLALQDSTSTQTTGSVALALNAWNRVEFHYKASATVGVMQAVLYKTQDSFTADETITSTATNTGTQITVATFGINVTQSNALTVRLDDVNVNTIAFPGPSLASFTGSSGGVGDSTSTLTETATLTSTGSSLSDASSTLTEAAQLTATGVSTTSASSTLTEIASLTSTSSGVGAASSLLTELANVDGSGDTTSSADASPAVNAVLTGSGDTVSSSTVTLLAAAVLLGTGDALGNAAANLSAEAALTGISSGISAGTATPTVSGSTVIQAAGTGAGDSQGAASLLLSALLSGVGSGQSSAVASVALIQALFLSGVGNSTSSGTASIFNAAGDFPAFDITQAMAGWSMTEVNLFWAIVAQAANWRIKQQRSDFTAVAGSRNWN